MPDMERINRQFHIDNAKTETERLIAGAYYMGMDRARKEVAWIAAGVAVIVVLANI